jgi:hypothetical protein
MKLEMKNYTVYMKGGLFHREEGPAVIEPNVKQWIQNGIYHSDNGPAIMNKETKECSYWIDGKCIGVGIVIDEETFNMHWNR